MLKNELEYHQDYEIEFEVINDITKYIEPKYNQTRIQKGLGYKATDVVWLSCSRCLTIISQAKTYGIDNMGQNPTFRFSCLLKGHYPYYYS